MKITRRAWNDYISKLAKCNKGAADAMWAYMSKHGIEDVEALINYGYAVATKYGEASAAIAAEMYDATAALAGASVPAAVPAETATYGEVTAAVKKSAEYGNTKTISSAVSRLVKQAGADTTIQNAARDNAQWAWIPSGDTCAFCIALASRGWQYASKRVMKGDHAQHIHANCDCTFAVRFDERSSYDSYDPKKYEDIYNSAEGSSSKDKINSIRRELYKTNGDTIREQKRIAYAARKERKQLELFAKDDADTLKFFGADARDDLQKIVTNSTIQLENGFAAFPEGDPLQKYVQAVKPLENYFDVAMHGTPTAVGFGTEETNMSPRLLASTIRHTGGWNGQNVRLLSCSTGKQSGDGYCFAEELANALGVTVKAPDDTLYIYPNGKLEVGKLNDGHMVDYKPNERGRKK